MEDNLIAALAAYIPRDRAAQLLAGAPLAREGAALIADIAGFTPLTEALARALSPARGAEELTRALNSVFAPLIAELHAYGGSVVKFGGDALIIWFPRARRARRASVLRHAIAAALAMQAAIVRHGRVQTDAGAFTLSMKLGLAYGPVLRTRLGDPARGFEDVIGGRTLDRMAEAEHHASPGELLVDPEGLPELAALAELGELRDGFVVVRGLRGAVRRGPAGAPAWPALAAGASEALRPYLPAEVFAALRDGRAQPAELRPVVSIFVQFTGISYEAGAVAEAQLASYFAAAQRAAARYGGRVNRLITGDKGSVLHLIFGAPQALEDLERRAALCALELRRAAAALPFITAQRVGMTVGRAFAGPVGAAARRDYTVMGEAINRSARLMQRAEPGQLVVDALLAARLAGAFALAPLGAAQLKGVAEPVELFSLLAETTATARPAPPPVGREAELAQLRARLERLRAGAGGAAVLIGQLGLGKSHLLAALRAEASAGLAWASASAASYGPRVSGALVAGALRELLGLPGEPEAAAATLGPALAALLGARQGAEALPYLARLLGLPLAERAARALESLGGEGLRWRLTGLVRELVEAAAARGPVVLALDDVQWADPTSLDLLDALLPVAAARPLLLLLAARPGAEGRAAALLARLAAAGAAPLVLEPLGDAAATALVARHAPALAEGELAQLVGRGGGNPLFLVELARTAAAGAPLDELPDTVQGLVLAQLDRLPPAEREALQAAAVLGSDFSAKLVEAVLEPTTNDRRPTTDDRRASVRLSAIGHRLSAIATDHLPALEEAGFLERQGGAAGGGYSFRHGLIRESAYAALLHARRRELHGVAASALERLYPTRLADLAGTLALHHEGAGELLLAARSYGQAADGARLLYANEEADAGYQKALALLDAAATPDDDLRARTHLKLAQVRMNAGDYTAAQELYDVAFELLERVEAQRPTQQRRHRKAQVFRMGADEPETLDPALLSTTAAEAVVCNLFEGLVEFDADLNIVPAVARRWQVEDHGRRYVFSIRSDLRWSDGAPLTAHDFVFAWQRTLQADTDAPMAQQLFVVQGAAAFHSGQAGPALGIRALDALTFVVDLEQACAYFLPLLTIPAAYPQPAHMVARLGKHWSRAEHLVGNGPYSVARWSKGAWLELRPNPMYGGAGHPLLRHVQLVFGPPQDDWTRRSELDWCRVVDREEVLVEQSQQTLTLQYLTTYFLAFGCATAPFQDVGLRGLFAASLDREALVHEVWSGVPQAALGGMIPPGVLGHTAALTPTANTPQAASWPEGYGTPAHPIRLGATQGFGQLPAFLQAAWQSALKLTVEVVEDVPVEELLQGLRDGFYHLAVLGWELSIPDPDQVLRALYHSLSPVNYFGWANHAFDRMLEQAAQTNDRPLRMALYHQADRLLVEQEIVAVPLYYWRAFSLLSSAYEVGEAVRVIRGGKLKLKQLRLAH